jgi:ABC-type Fe3+-hydroxamate transport system substrate-binding protein
MADLENRHHQRPYYFPASITLGDFLAIIVIIGSVFGAYNAATTRLTRMEDKVEAIDGRLADINAKLGKMSRSGDSFPVWGERP